MTGDTQQPRARWRAGWRGWGVRALLSAAVLAALFWFLPTGDILAGVSRIPLVLFLGVVGLFLATHAVAALKWWLQIGRTVPVATALHAHYVGLTANLCLPGVAGGDAARIAVAWTRAEDRSRLAAGSLSDRLIDLVALCCIALAGLLLAEDADVGLAMQVLPLTLGLFVLGLFVGPRIAAAAWKAIPRLPARTFVLRTCEEAIKIGGKPIFLVAMLLLSVTIQGALILLAHALAAAAGVEVSIAAWAFAWSLAKLIVVLPVSLGGLGVREALLAALLAPYGAAAADVVAGGLAWQGVLFAGGTVGGLVLATSGRSRNNAAQKGQRT